MTLAEKLDDVATRIGQEFLIGMDDIALIREAAAALAANVTEIEAMHKQIEASQHRRMDIGDVLDLVADVCELGVVPWAHTDISNDEADQRLAKLKAHPLVAAVIALRAQAEGDHDE